MRPIFELTATFMANGRKWLTDAGTLAHMAGFRNAGITFMVGAAFRAGINSGRIIAAE